MEAVVSNLKQFIIDELLYAEEIQELSTDQELLATGMLDSMATAQLMLHIEDQFAIKLPPGELTFDNFNTVAALSAMIGRHQNS